MDGTQEKKEVQTGLNPNYTFENFVEGDSNRVAVAVAKSVGEKLRHNFSPVLIVGDLGMGKTHLLNAIGNEALRRQPHAYVYYTTSEGFTVDLIDGIRNQRMPNLRGFYRNLDLLLIDDVEFIAGKDQTQEEFSHTLAALQHAGRQVVLSSTKFPAQVPNYEPRVLQLLQSGIIVNVQTPDIHDRRRLLSAKWSKLPHTFDAAELGFIAEKVNANNGVLLGALNTVVTHVQHSGGRFDVDEIEKLLSKYQAQ
jgi:chromosomal replication initiator protein